MSFQNDTIAAIATPLGEGGISVIRLSGPEAFRLMLEHTGSNQDVHSLKSHTLRYRTFYGTTGQALDQVVASVFRAPNSYTGEDVVEISCHGGMLVTKRILESILVSGARHAAPGEFTKRAFLNGKLDLAQAEAVAELIHATSDKSHKTSLSHLQGEFSDRIEKIRSDLMNVMGLLELELDFAEDGYEFVDKKQVEEQIAETLSEVEKLLQSYTAGKAIREGVNTVLIGAPNAGKSSLMNRLMKESRAIVTETPGTTRDVISENITIKGVLFRLSDTAGIRTSENLAEQEGVRRTREKLRGADVIILVIDASKSIRAQLDDIGDEAMGMLVEKKGAVRVALNKIDIAESKHKPPQDLLQKLGAEEVSRVSAKSGEGVVALEDALLDIVPGFTISGAPEGEIVTTARHHDAFLRVAESLRLSLGSTQDGSTGEFIALDLRNALDGLGEVTGRVTTEDVLNKIFSQFCIGK
jgi:tRNA modification GTPase